MKQLLAYIAICAFVLTIGTLAILEYMEERDKIGQAPLIRGQAALVEETVTEHLICGTVYTYRPDRRGSSVAISCVKRTK
jgi:hypothetical protein